VEELPTATETAQIRDITDQMSLSPSKDRTPQARDKGPQIGGEAIQVKDILHRGELPPIKASEKTFLTNKLNGLP